MQKDYIQVEDYSISEDMDFLQNAFIPYLKDIFVDLQIRCPHPKLKEKLLGKVVFLEYCNLPGIIGERLFSSISTGGDKAGFITESQFINAFVLIFNSQLDHRLKLTFEMYDFNHDALVVKEDVRIIMSFVPFKRNFKLNMNSKKLSPLFIKKSRVQCNESAKIDEQEGLYKQDEGKNLDYQDRKIDQLEIRDFLNQVFENRSAINFQEYQKFNYEISSEMFFSIMGVLHERIPCAANFYRLKKMYQIQKQGLNCHVRSSSLSKTIASPTMFKNIQVIINSPQAIRIIEKSPMIYNGQQIRKPNAIDSEDEKISELDLDSHYQMPETTKQTKGERNLRKGFILSHDNEDKMIIRNKREGSENSNNIIRMHNIPKNGKTLPFMQRRLLNRQSQLSDYNSPSQASTQLSPYYHQLKQAQDMNSTVLSPHSPQSAKQQQQQITFLKKWQQYKSPQDSNKRYQQSTSENNIPIEEKNNDNQVFTNYSKASEENGIFYEGDVYLQTKTGKYKRYKGMIMQSEFYCYSQKDQTKHKLMHSLKGSYIKKLPVVNDDFKNRTLYPLKFIIPPEKCRIMYFLSENEQLTWYEKLKTSMGQVNIEDFYIIDKQIGHGSFGLVNMGYHIKTGQQVAIKTIKKHSLDQEEILQQRKEIEVLKICQHPNIVHLLDFFEDYKAFYIVLEYMKGGDLFDYLKSRRKLLPEQKSKMIIQKMAQALQYLHTYGIIHRDLKLENIMMTDDSDNAIPKLADFGLAKVLGPQETSSEPFGTAGYAAPEVLNQQPYGFSCDIWSLGCIAAILVSGKLPFEDLKSQNAVERTIHEELNLSKPIWKTVSKQAVDFVAKLLEKDPEKRLTLDQVLNHEWLRSQSL